MTRFRDDPEADALGQALAALRKARGLSQAEAGARMGVTSQAWGLYEAGRRPGMFRPDVQRRLPAALDLTPEDLALEMARRPGAASASAERLEEGARAFSGVGPPGPDRRTLQLRDDDLAPWAGSGVVLVYDLAASSLQVARVVLAVANRPGPMPPVHADVLRQPHRAVPLPMLDISSTNIRQRLSRGDAVADLQPPGVARYIDQHHLYRKGTAH